MVNHRKFPNLSQIQKIIQKIQNFWENDFGISQKFFHHHPKSSNSGTERRSSSPRWGNGQRATVYSNIIYGIYIYTEVYYFHTIIIAHVIVLRIYIYILYTGWLLGVFMGFLMFHWLVLMDHDLDTVWGLMWTSNWESLDFPGHLRSTLWSPAQPGISTNARARKKDGWASEASG